jgi:MFS family permease
VIAIAATLPLLIGKWSLSPGQIGLLIAAPSVGQLVGALLFPALAERFGRLRSIGWSAGIIGLMSLACGFAPSFEIFLLLRIVQGLGLGGELPVAATYINEVTRATAGAGSCCCTDRVPHRPDGVECDGRRAGAALWLE